MGEIEVYQLVDQAGCAELYWEFYEMFTLYIVIMCMIVIDACIRGHVGIIANISTTSHFSV